MKYILPLFLLAAACDGASCGSCGESDPVVDAGHDAGSDEDAGSDLDAGDDMDGGK